MCKLVAKNRLAAGTGLQCLSAFGFFYKGKRSIKRVLTSLGLLTPRSIWAFYGDYFIFILFWWPLSLQFIAAHNKVRFMFEIYSIVDYVTIPPAFLAVALNRHWTGEVLWLIDWLIDCLLDWLLDWLLDCLIDWSTDCSTDWSIDWMNGWLIIFLLRQRPNGSFFFFLLGLRFLRALYVLSIPDILQFCNVLRTSSNIRLAQLLSFLTSVILVSAGFFHLVRMWYCW